MQYLDVIAEISTILGLIVSVIALVKVDKTLRLVSKNKINLDASVNGNIKIGKANNSKIEQSSHDIVNNSIKVNKVNCKHN